MTFRRLLSIFVPDLRDSERQVSGLSNPSINRLRRTQETQPLKSMNRMLRRAICAPGRIRLIKTAFALICVLAAVASPAYGHETATSAELKYNPAKFRSERTETVKSSNMTHFTDGYLERLAKRGIFLDYFSEPAETPRPAKAPAKADEQMYTLTVNLKYNKDEVGNGIDLAIFNNETGDKEYIEYSLQPDELTATVPRGSYDIAVMFTTKVVDLIVLSADNIEVNGDTEITLNTDDATVNITWNPLMPDGSPVSSEWELWNPDTFQPTGEYEAGNAFTEFTNIICYNTRHPDINCLRIIANVYRVKVGEILIDMGHLNVRTMPSDHYRFYYYPTITSTVGNVLINMSADATESKTVTNDLKNYVTLKPDFVYSPYVPEPHEYEFEGEQYVSYFDKEKTCGIWFDIIRHGENIGYHGTLFNNSNYEYKINKWINICQDPAYFDELMLLPQPVLIEGWRSESMIGTYIGYMDSPSQVWVKNNINKYGEFLNFPNDDTPLIDDIINPYLSFDLSKPHVWNYGCPTFVFSMPWNLYEYSYMGRLGERREVDLLSTRGTVKVDGMAPSEQIFELLQQGKLPDKGKIDFLFTNTNVVIDDIPGKNVAEVSFDMSKADHVPPTLQIVRFKDKDDNITDRYSKAEDGVIEFYAGDFTFDHRQHIGWFTDEWPADVIVEYAPYGSDEYLPLEADHIPERDFMPGFGAYYTGSLGKVDRESENGWFDVRITVIDEAGNYQRQVLSPAFKIGEGSGIRTPDASDIRVIVTEGEIKVYGAAKPEIEIYTPDGVRIMEAAASAVATGELNRGLYLIKVTDGRRQKVCKVRL